MDNALYIRVDGGPEIGMGHVIRCISLAQMLQGSFPIVFACIQLPEETRAEIASIGHKVILIKNEEEFFVSLKGRDTVVVLDGYNFSTEYQARVRALGALLVCIDDVPGNSLVADLIINHAPGINPSQYKALPHTIFALGHDFVLLRNAILMSAVRVKRDQNNKKVLLICFGGADPKNLTERALRVALRQEIFEKIIVITGPAWHKRQSLVDLADSDERIAYFHSLNEQEMCDQFEQADIAIVPASGIIHEVMAFHILPISGMYADNQRLMYQNLIRSQAVVDAGQFEEEAIQDALNNIQCDTLTVAPRIDGKSPDRIRTIFQQLLLTRKIRFRQATEKDEDLTFAWASDKRVRAFSFSTSEITRSQHSRWFKQKLADANALFLIAEVDGEVIGSVRFDIEEGCALISYLLDPRFHGKNLGLPALAGAIAKLMEDERSAAIRLIQGDVMKSNHASTKIFARLGFSTNELSDRYRFQKMVNV